MRIRGAANTGAETAPLNEDRLLETLLDLDADGYDLTGEGSALIYGPFEALERLQNGLRDHGWDVQEWEHCWHPLTNVTINDPETARQCLKLLDVLDELDDVSSVSANLELAPDLNL